MKYNHSAMLYAANVKCLAIDSFYKSAYDSVCIQRKEKINQYKQEMDRFRSLGAEILLQYALKEVGYQKKPVFFYGENGKPYLQDNKWQFNLSHSGDYVICAISDEEIGCDIEKIGNLNLKVAKRFFAEEESVYLESLASSDLQKEAFYRYWTIKESFLKATGLGMKLPMNSFSISLENTVCMKLEQGDRSYYFKEFPDISGYCCAICMTNEYLDIKMKMVDLETVIRTNDIIYDII